MLYSKLHLLFLQNIYYKLVLHQHSSKERRRKKRRSHTESWSTDLFKPTSLIYKLTRVHKVLEQVAGAPPKRDNFSIKITNWICSKASYLEIAKSQRIFLFIFHVKISLTLKFVKEIKGCRTSTACNLSPHLIKHVNSLSIKVVQNYLKWSTMAKNVTTYFVLNISGSYWSRSFMNT